jgi:hypothetical protein
VLDLSSTPNLETPQYTVLRVTNDYEIRRYAPFVVAEAPMGPGSSECAQHAQHDAVPPANKQTNKLVVRSGFFLAAHMPGSRRLVV